MLNSTKNDIIWLETVDSTSKELHRMMEDSLAGGYGNTFNGGRVKVVAADFQEAGRGRGAHRWHSEFGKNLLFSIFAAYSDKYVLRASEQELLTMASSLAVCDFLAEEGIDARIKLPNDIYVGTKKICGMLIENSLSGELMSWSIIGMGINVNELSFPQDLPNPVSMALLCGRDFDIKKCLKDFLRHFSVRFDAIWTEPDRLREDYSCKLLSTADFRESIAEAGSWAPNTDEPATKISAPASDRR